MALVPLRVLLDHTAENDYGVAAFNVNNMEQIQAIMEAAQFVAAAREAMQQVCIDRMVAFGQAGNASKI